MTTFSDNFNREDGPPGANWVLVSGAWVIASNQLSPGATGATIVILAATPMATNDHFAQITVAATTNASQGVVCRSDATLNAGYLLRNDGTSWGLFKVVSGVFTSIGSFAAAAVAGDVAKVQAIGSTITGWVNGVVRITVTDTAVPTGTGTGLRSVSTSGLKYDDFSAGDVTSGTTATAGLAAVAVAALQASPGAAAQPTAAAVAVAARAPVAAPAALPGTAAVAVAAYQAVPGVAALPGTAHVAGTAYTPGAAIVVVAGSAALGMTAYGVRNQVPPSTDVTLIGGREPGRSVAGRQPGSAVSGREPPAQV